MPRKFFKKYLPSHEAVRQNRFIGLFGELLHHHNLWHLHRRSVAGGVAVGLFAGLIPGSNPVQFFFAALFAILFKVNLPVAAATTLYSNPFTIVPLYIAAYAIGGFVTGNGAGTMPQTELHLMDKNISEWVPALIDWVMLLGKPLLVGIVLLALLLAVFGYFAVRGAWRLYIIYEWRKRAQRIERAKGTNGANGAKGTNERR
ncbi:MAG: DUF2062 domain-containing protein [Nitrosospira sp.]|nr:DUF2062 domain-containing protein [Nitrosospira sp.]